MSVKSCLTCPSLLTAAEAQQFFDTPTALPMCARFGFVFSDEPDTVRVQVVESRAKNCQKHGAERPTTPSGQMPGTAWYEPNTDLMNTTNEDVKACVNCENYDNKAKACAATGRLILEGREELEATDCRWRKKIRVQGKQVAAPLYKQVEKVPFAGSTPVTAPTPKSDKKPKEKKVVPLVHIEPSKYESDAPVQEAEKAAGIRAWRAFPAPDGAPMKKFHLPIWDSAFFGERAELIPQTGSDFGDPSLYQDHSNVKYEFYVQVYKLDNNLVLIGEPGAGKTEAVRSIAYNMNMPFTRIPFHEDSDPDQILGMYSFDPTVGTYLDLGVLPTSIQKPGVVLSDEPNTPRNDAIAQTYRSLNDSSRELVIYKERIKRDPYCFHIMCMNPDWDFRNSGTRPLASADSRRLTFKWMPNPDDDQLRLIISTHVQKLDKEEIDPELLEAIVKVGKDLRRESERGSLPGHWTVAQDIKVARLAPFFGFVSAYRRAFFDYVEPTVAENMLKYVTQNIGYSSKYNFDVSGQSAT